MLITTMEFGYRYDRKWGFEVMEDMLARSAKDHEFYCVAPELHFPEGSMGAVFDNNQDVEFFRFLTSVTTPEQRRKVRLAGDTTEWLTLPFEVFDAFVEGKDVLALDYLRADPWRNEFYRLKWPMPGYDETQLSLCSMGMERLGLTPRRAYYFKLALDGTSV